MKNYDQQAEEFAKKHGVTMEVKFLKFGKHFDGDKYLRDIYKIKLTRKGRSFEFDFGQSIAKSDYYFFSRSLTTKEPIKWTDGRPNAYKTKNEAFRNNLGDFHINHNKGELPTIYDILACLTKYDPGTLENFCDEFGCNPDSKKDTRIYEAVREEYINVLRLFGDIEEELQEIE